MLKEIKSHNHRNYGISDEAKRYKLKQLLKTVAAEDLSKRSNRELFKETLRGHADRLLLPFPQVQGLMQKARQRAQPSVLHDEFFQTEGVIRGNVILLGYIQDASR